MRSNLTQEENEYFRLIESSAFELKNHAEIKKNKLFPINALFPNICKSSLLVVSPTISVSTLNAFFDTKWCDTIISIAKIFNSWKLLCFFTIISPCILCNLCTLYTAAMSYTTALGLHYALNCTIFNATVAPLLLPDYPTRISISATMCLSPSCSHPPCYLQDRDEISDDVIITKPRNRCVKVTVISAHPLTVPSGINPRATVASIKVLFRGVVETQCSGIRHSGSVERT